MLFLKTLRSMSIFKNKPRFSLGRPAKAFILNGTSLGIAQLCSLYTISFLSKRLSVAEYGQLGALQSLVLLFWPIISLGLVAGVNNSFIRKSEEQARSHLGLLLQVWVMSTIIAFVCLKFIDRLVLQAFQLSFSHVVIVILCSLGTLLSTAAVGILRSTLRPRSAVLIEVAAALLTLTSTIIFFDLMMFRSIETRLVSILLGFVPAAIFILFASRFHPIFNQEQRIRLRKYLVIGWPLVFHNITGWFTGSMDRVVLLNFHGPEVAGHYTVSAQIGNLFGLVTLVISQVWNPIASHTLHEGHPAKTSRLKKQATIIALALPIIALIFGMLGPHIFSLILAKSYVVDTTVVTLLSLKGAIDGWYYLLVVPYFLFEKNIYLSSITLFFGILTAGTLWGFGAHLDSIKVALTLLIFSLGQTLAILIDLKRRKLWNKFGNF